MREAPHVIVIFFFFFNIYFVSFPISSFVFIWFLFKVSNNDYTMCHLSYIACDLFSSFFSFICFLNSSNHCQHSPSAMLCIWSLHWSHFSFKYEMNSVTFYWYHFIRFHFQNNNNNNKVSVQLIAFWRSL